MELQSYKNLIEKYLLLEEQFEEYIRELENRIEVSKVENDKGKVEKVED